MPCVCTCLRLSQRALGAAPPEADLEGIIVTGAKTLWRPPGSGDAPWDLWTHLRLQYCSTVWTLTTRRNRTGRGFDAAAIVAMAAAALERAIRHDWLRLSVAAERLPDMPTWCTLGLARVQLAPEVFEARWLARGVLADLPAGGGQDALRVHVPRALEEPEPEAGS